MHFLLIKIQIYTFEACLQLRHLVRGANPQNSKYQFMKVFNYEHIEYVNKFMF